MSKWRAERNMEFYLLLSREQKHENILQVDSTFDLKIKIPLKAGCK